jgi:glycosyltransferase involved in cell wall biosynthesis
MFLSAIRFCNRKTKSLHSGAGAFDPVFYLRCYPDLASIDSAKRAQTHYLRHGRAEGRFANAQMKEEADYDKFVTPSATFDLTAYRELNPDLRASLISDREYIVHYIRHGLAEGRPCIANDETNDPDAHSWEKLLNVSQYAAWIFDLDRLEFASRADAVDHFRSTGNQKLAPLSFDLLFDPDFYRVVYAPKSSLDNEALYRSWLTTGLDENKAPNEARLLYPYLKNSPFPVAFDWVNYATMRMGKVRLPGRWAALAHLFTTERDWFATRQFVIEDPSLVEAIAEFRFRLGKSDEAAEVLMLMDGADLEGVARVKKPSVLLLAGKIALDLKQAKTARNAFEQALRIDQSVFEYLDQAVRSNLACGAFTRVFTLLRDHRTAWLGDPRFETLAKWGIDTIYERHCAEAHAALNAEINPDSDFLSAWSDDFEERLAAIAMAIETIEMAPAKLEPESNGSVLLLADQGIRQCTHYRIEQKQEQFDAGGIDLLTHGLDDVDGFMANLIGARAAIFYRVPATPKIIRAILAARGLGIPTYYEIDDLIFSVQSYPDDFASYGDQLTLREYRGLQYGVPLFAAALKLCDRAIASTEALLDHMSPMTRGRRGMLLPNGLDSRNDEFLAIGNVGAPPIDAIVRIFYGSGTLAHTSDFSELCVPALVRLLEQQSRVELVLVGHVARDPRLTPYLHRIHRYPIITSLDTYWSLLGTCNINLAVLRPGLANDCKSEIKWLEAAMFAIPTVASDTATLRDIIQDGTNGLLASDCTSWYTSLYLLVNDAELRRHIGRNARATAVAYYRLPAMAQRLRDEFGCFKGAAPTPEPLRVLVVNVFFAPQSIGGATRVVENNVLHIAQDCPDITLGVVCTDLGQETPYRLRTSQFGKTPVFRISAPMGASENQAFDEDMAAPFCTILARFRPDLVHFHSTQRLTATVVRECRNAGIPYLVTLHDAWWFSPWQFLVDREGKVRLPQDDLWTEHVSGRRQDALTRRQLLRAQLLNAERVLTVSESFAEVCRAAQLGPVTVIANGLPDLRPLLAIVGAPGILRLGHIGNRVSHKGADLIEAALRRGDYPNLVLLMIDGALTPGETRTTVWGTSQVTLAAPWPQEDVADLYSRIDVLLAPSTWPESYGLVAREAQFYGLWVVSSKIGAMGEDIVEGVNGFRIDTDDRRELDAVLARMNSNPDSFRQGTAPVAGKHRHARDQARELAALYRAVAATRVPLLLPAVSDTPVYSL